MDENIIIVINHIYNLYSFIYRDCVVCMSNPRSMLILPCKHYSVCEECSVKLQRHSYGRAKCPLCKTNIDSFEKFYA